MIFNVRPIRDGSPGERWHWTIYEDPQGRFVRDGQITGDRDKAERAARAAIAIMGGRFNDDEEVD
ncbi:hypothetical protein D3273_22270 [Lichenibacterium minor]|uniref:Uncharacterized protein n=1 Tax=Lichenibacterium minor TaxID=2316528 RepID=A0A4Q2U499_9HYPH|nr:hypothetical protein [Lichenibacterium minor]RYC29791.1 hypothetical protein D3273_22270 [Lichenibacterium minor]